MPDGKGGTIRKLRFKVLGEVTAEHRRNKDRKTGKLRVPNDLQKLADELTSAANTNTNSISVLTTIGQFVDGIYLPDKKRLKPASYEALSNRWKCYLKDRIGLASCATTSARTRLNSGVKSIGISHT